MSARTRRALIAAGVLMLLPAVLDPAGAARPKPSATTTATTTTGWASASDASIQPGVETVTEGGQCTANFVFTDVAGAVYIGQAAHCSGTGGATETDGCLAASHPLGTAVVVEGSSKPGTMVYNSWLTMQARGESDPNACAYNDFALVKLDPSDAGKVNPSVPFFGGPTGLSTSSTRVGEAVYSYGNSSLRLGLSPLSPKRGISVGDDGAGWSHLVYTVSPGIPGDSGSAFLASGGEALGVLSTLQLLPLAASNGVGDLRLELAYLNAHSGLPTVTLALGTEPFRTNRLL